MQRFKSSVGQVSERKLGQYSASESIFGRGKSLGIDLTFNFKPCQAHKTLPFVLITLEDYEDDYEIMEGHPYI